MDITPKTKKAMSKDEVSLLVDLIQSHPTITSKETNAATNKLKEECWASLTNSFNSKSGQIPRQLCQLKLKWDNLKKAARKRAANIRMNSLKTGGGKPDFIPPDEILDKVIGVLGSTCSGFEVPFGGDGIGSTDHVILDLDNADSDDLMQIHELLDTNDARVNIPDESLLPSSTTKKRKIDFSPQPGTSGGNTGEQGVKYIYGMTSISKPLQSKAKKLKLKTKQDDGRLQRNLAIAKYYEKKAEKLDIELKLLKLELANKENNCSINI